MFLSMLAWLSSGQQRAVRHQRFALCDASASMQRASS
jgi:hypothetical protein